MIELLSVGLAMGLESISEMVSSNIELLSGYFATGLGSEYSKYSFPEIEQLSTVVLALILSISSLRIVYLMIALGQSENPSQEKKQIKNLIIAVIIAVSVYGLARICLMYIV